MTLYIDKTSYTSPNYGERPEGMNGVISAIVLHDGEGTRASDLERLTNDSVPMKSRVSAHYYVDRLSNVYQLVEPKYEAWHAGVSDYLGRQRWNEFAIGIETEHKLGQMWPRSQRDTIAELCRELITHYHIQEPWIAAHRWIAPGRKFDPTDWPNAELKVWIHGLYVAPTHLLPGLTGDMTCGQGFYDFYHVNGGFGMWGYALTSEATDIDSLGRECTWMRFERAIYKYVYGEGVHLSLLIEAASKKWLL